MNDATNDNLEIGDDLEILAQGDYNTSLVHAN